MVGGSVTTAMTRVQLPLATRQKLFPTGLVESLYLSAV